MVKELASDAEFDQTLAEAGDKCVIIDFFATWCGPCVRIGPKFIEGLINSSRYTKISEKIVVV